MNVLSPTSCPSSSFSLTSGSPAAETNVGSQSRWLTISFDTVPAGILPGQRTIAGTRNAPSQFVFFSLRNGVVAGVGPRVHVRPVVGRVDDDRVLGDAELVELVEHLPDVLVVVDHRVVVGRLPAPGLSDAPRLRVRAEVHVRRVDPDEERLAASCACRLMKSSAPSMISSSIVSIRFFVSGPVSSIVCLPLVRRPGSGARRAGRTAPGSSGSRSGSGSPASPAPPRR